MTRGQKIMESNRLQCYSSIEVSRLVLKLEANNQVTPRFLTETINEHEFYLKYRYYRA